MRQYPRTSLRRPGTSDLVATELVAVEPSVSGIRNLDHITWLVQQNKFTFEPSGAVHVRSAVGTPLSVEEEEGAATQIAIWSMAEKLPINERTVSNRAVRERAQFLARSAMTVKNYKLYRPVINRRIAVEREDSSLGEVRLRVTLGRDYVTERYKSPRCLDIRIHGRRAKITTGLENHINPSRGIGGSELDAQPGCNARLVKPDADTNTATLILPLSGYKYAVEIGDKQSAGPGYVLSARHGPTLVITAARFRQESTTISIIDPTGLTAARSFFEQNLVARVTPKGVLGYIKFLLAIFLLLLVFNAANSLARAVVSSFPRLCAMLRRWLVKLRKSDTGRGRVREE